MVGATQKQGKQRFARVLPTEGSCKVAVKAYLELRESRGLLRVAVAGISRVVGKLGLTSSGNCRNAVQNSSNGNAHFFYERSRGQRRRIYNNNEANAYPFLSFLCCFPMLSVGFGVSHGVRKDMTESVVFVWYSCLAGQSVPSLTSDGTPLVHLALSLMALTTS